MYEMQLLSSSSKDNSQEPEGIKETNSLGLPSRQRSCAAVNTPSACVNKAIHHIQDLEMKVEETFQQYDHLYKLEKIPWNTENVEEIKDIWSSVSSDLKAEQSLYWKDLQPLKQKTAAILGEVTELVTRLETERKQAEEALEFEIQRRKKLYLSADKLSLWRLQQLPIAVQKEWEKCSQDVTDFQWHFEEKNQQLQDAVDQLSKIDVVNAKIQEHIDFMKEYSPLLEEKLTFECDSIEEAKRIYMEAKALYDTVHQKLLMVRAIHAEVIEECEKRRKLMSEQIQEAEFVLNDLINRLKEDEALFNDYCTKINELKEAIAQNKILLEELIKQETDANTDIMAWHDKVRRLILKITTQENENKDLLNEYLEEMILMETSKTGQQSDIKDLKDKLMKLKEEIDYLQRENQILYNENGGFLQKFRESTRRKMGYQAEIQVLLKNIRRLEEHLNKVSKELCSVELAYDEAKNKLEELEQNIVKEKMRFKNLEENIKKQIKDEVSAWKLTQKRVKALQSELEKMQKEQMIVEENIQKKLADLEECVAEQSAILARSKDMQNDLNKKTSDLKQKIQELDEEEKKIKKELDEQKNYFKNLLANIEEKYLDISSQLAKVNGDIAKFQKEIAKLNNLSEKKQKQLDTTQKCLADLREKYARINAKEQNAQRLVDFLHDRLDYVEKKVMTDSRVFEEQLWDRQKSLKAKKIAVDDAMSENLRLAQEYQMLQICYLNDKNKLMDFCDHKVRAEAALRDQQQLSQLQRKLHKVLVEYFKLRALYSQAGLAKFQAASHENFQKILAVQFSVC
ncbi:coiled-coil domain-containing protein 178 isoform X2 [Varanus komodoensis]|uniref:coiled-coil domain-containing protein 178 isoform X2 n=1 Tax=Varanus komodoensis TaxID=61221 RepID=UPI001CF7DC6F|nr:coiled-coil domain-containing protein 178 isoform X2 [Varanus komodoensis]